MKFKVSSDIKGSLVLNTISRVVKAGYTVFVDDDKIYEKDIQRAIKRGFLIPVVREADKKRVRDSILNAKSQILITNLTSRTLIINDINVVLSPNGSVLKDINQLDKDILKHNTNKGLIKVDSDVDDFMEESGYNDFEIEVDESVDSFDALLDGGDDDLFNKEIDNKEEDNIDELLDDGDDKIFEEDINEGDNDDFIVWDMRNQKSKKGEKVPKTKTIRADNDESEDEEIDTVDEENKKKKIAKKKKNTKKSKKSNKKSTKKSKKKSKKKEKSNTKKNNNKIEAVGDKKNPKTADDAAIELDSRGNVIEKPSNFLNHLVDGFEAPDIDTVD